MNDTTLRGGWTINSTISTLTARDIRALRYATGGITFHLDQSGQGMVRAHKRGDHTSDGFADQHTIFTDSRVQDYSGSTGTYSGYHMEMYRPDQTMVTLINRMRAGDTLRLEWTANNDNPLNREIGWHRDELRLRIIHANGKEELYLVEARVGPDNTARMIRRTR